VKVQRSTLGLGAVMLVMLCLVPLGCGGGSSPYRADCEQEASRNGFSEGSQFRDNAIQGCEEALKTTRAKPGIFAEEP
jgi:hypothetical protein